MNVPKMKTHLFKITFGSQVKHVINLDETHYKFSKYHFLFHFSC